jgi:hypothetical protein
MAHEDVPGPEALGVGILDDVSRGHCRLRLRRAKRLKAWAWWEMAVLVLMSQRRMIVSGLRHCRNASSICSRWGRLQTEHLRAWRSSEVRAGESSWSREGFGGEGRGLGWGRGLGLERDLDLGARFWRGGLPKLHFRIGYDFYNGYSGCHGANAGEASGAVA